MNEEDLRNCFAMFALCGAIMRGDTWTPKRIWDIADDMIDAKNSQEEGIVAIKKRIRRKP